MTINRQNLLIVQAYYYIATGILHSMNLVNKQNSIYSPGNHLRFGVGILVKSWSMSVVVIKKMMMFAFSFDVAYVAILNSAVCLEGWHPSTCSPTDQP